ncbi:unnamed protein product [Cladocopium goreaui]|uniref:Uncharacterized protein n=1 Tax=Cladocopium goreaui TaxID=2562237 RepID=A0A9P1FUK6_9DINO|nr:unnamed protein product [Cladocopium goreaui]
MNRPEGQSSWTLFGTVWLQGIQQALQRHYLKATPEHSQPGLLDWLRTVLGAGVAYLHPALPVAILMQILLYVLRQWPEVYRSLRLDGVLGSALHTWARFQMMLGLMRTLQHFWRCYLKKKV